MLQDFESNGNDFNVSGVQSGFDWDNQLRNDGKDLCTTLFEHIRNTLDGEETVGVNLLADTFEEDGKVMMVVELRNIDLPVDLILGSVFNCDGQISTVVETTEFT